MSHFLAHYQRKHQRQVPGFSQAAVKAMFHYPFPGNIRELQNLIERAVILATDGEPIEPHHLFAGGEQSGGGVMSLHLQGNSGGTLHAQGMAGVGTASMQAPQAAAAASARAGVALAPANSAGGGTAASGGRADAAAGVAERGGECGAGWAVIGDQPGDDGLSGEEVWDLRGSDAEHGGEALAPGTSWVGGVSPGRPRAGSLGIDKP